MQQRTTGTTQKAISEETGIEQTVLSRWKLGRNRPDAQNVIQFARATNRPPVEALIAAGYLAPEEVGGAIEIAQSPADLTDEELLTEVRTRMEARHGLEADEEPGASGEARKDQKNGAADRRDSQNNDEGLIHQDQGDSADDYEMVGRDVGGISEGESTRRRMDEEAERGGDG